MNKSVKKHRTDEELTLIALKHENKTDFFTCDNAAYQAAQRRKILDKICLHMSKRNYPVGPKASNYCWTDEMLAQEALKYTDKTEFIKNNSGAYQMARDRGILDRICSHMPKYRRVPREKHSGFKWTLQKIEEEALKYSSREEFKENSGGAYSAAQDLKILDLVCSHMPNGGNSSKGELAILDIIKKLYPDAKKLVDRRVKIEGKSHIKGFEIDIFISELGLGIEFDGRYFHSFKGLKRRNPHWPDEDLHNYHQLKDSWFATKGIKILHINEKDWKKDPQGCINQCLDFLEFNKCA